MFATIRKVTNLEQKFKNLGNVAKKAKAFTLNDIVRAPGSGTSADLIAHQQGVCRLDGKGDFIISGCVKNTSFTSNDRPYFYVIKDFKGSKAVEKNDYYQIKNEDNPLCTDDVNKDDHRRFTHPGGIQVAENILAVGLEDYKDTEATVNNDRSFLRFYDISNEYNITEIKTWAWGRVDQETMTASAIGITKSTRYGQWILAIRGKDHLEILSTPQNAAIGGTKFGTIGIFGTGALSTRLKNFQGINLFWSDDDKLYLIGGPDGGSNDDILFLYELQYTLYPGANYINSITNARYVDRVHFYRSGSGPRFEYGVGVYVNQNNQFEVYSIEMHVIDNKIRCNVWNEDAF